MEAKPFLRQRYRVQSAQQSDSDHWSGGKAYHRGAKCPVCKIPLLLLWDINCKDPRFPRGKFGPLSRLPMYFCWGCVNEVAYQVVESDAIRLHKMKKYHTGPSFPYDPYPESFARRGLKMSVEVPPEIFRLQQDWLTRWRRAKGSDAVTQFSNKERKFLDDYFGHPAPMPMCFFHHQFGGKPVKLLWSEPVECPNPKCEGSMIDRIRGRKPTMKFLAGILNDPRAGLPMVDPVNGKSQNNWNYHVDVQFHICDCCWTIFGCNRCD